MPGRQFANDFATPEPISVDRDKYKDEIPSDRPYHQGVTPGHSNSLYMGRHYSDDWMGGYDAYGVTVADKGQSPSKEQVSINPNSADRGKDS
jgi:hypothetical protein